MFRRPRRLHRASEHDTKNDKQTAPHDVSACMLKHSINTENYL